MCVDFGIQANQAGIQAPTIPRSGNPFNFFEPML